MASLVYRIETLDGIGMYSTPAPLYYTVRDILTQNEKRPEPMYGSFNSDHSFGFCDLWQLTSWVGTISNAKDLVSLGLVVRVYRAKKVVHIDEKQVIFYKKDARLVKHTSIIECFHNLEKEMSRRRC